MFKKRLIKRILLFLLIYPLQVSPATDLSRELTYDELTPDTGWKIVAGGVEVKEVFLHRPNWYGMGVRKEDIKGEKIFVDEIQKINIKVLRIDPKKVRISLIYCHDYGEKSGADIKSLVKKSGAIGALTGGYYDYEKDQRTLKPVGILTVNSRQVSKWLAGGSGIFMVKKNGSVEIIPKEKYEHSPDILHAVQAGPILVKDGEIKINKPPVFNEFKILPRTAIGLTKEKKIIMLACETGFNGLSLDELAEIMKRLKCTEALNLDGGPSAQMFLAYKNMEVYVRGTGKIIDAIGFFQK